MYRTVDGKAVTAEAIRKAYERGMAVLVLKRRPGGGVTVGLRLDGRQFDTRGQCASVWEEAWTVKTTCLESALRAARGDALKVYRTVVAAGRATTRLEDAQRAWEQARADVSIKFEGPQVLVKEYLPDLKSREVFRGPLRAALRVAKARRLELAAAALGLSGPLPKRRSPVAALYAALLGIR